MLILAAALVLAMPKEAAQAKPAPSQQSARAEAYYQFSLGLQERLAGNVEEALAAYRRAQKLDPQSSAIRVETARLLREMGRLEEALAEARAAVDLDDEDVDAHVTIAQLEQIQAAGPEAEKSLQRAAEHYEMVVRVRPTDGQSLLNLAGIYGQLQKHDDAARIWEIYLALDPGNFEAHVQRGTHLLLAGDYDKAAAAMRSALVLQPGSARAYQILGDISTRREKPEEAIASYRKALESDPGNVRVRLGLGEVLFDERQTKDALVEAEAVLRADPQNRYALDLQARSLRDLRRFDEADAVADKLIAGDRGDLKSSYLKVTIAEQRRDHAKAAALLEELLARPASPEDATTRRVFHVHLGFAYQQMQRFDDAAQQFARAIASGPPPDANLLTFHAEALSLAGKKDDALGAARTARARFPDDVDLAVLEATLLREKGDTSGASTIIATVREKANQVPGDKKEKEEKARTLARVADFYRRAGDFPQAEGALRQALVVDPKSLATLFQLGAVLERQKRHDAAETVFREALAIEPESAPVLNYLGYMNADRNVRVEEAYTLIQKAVDIDPQSAAYQDSLGWALYRLNRLEAAEQAVRRALERDGDNAVILDHLGDILAKRGHVAEALSCWQKAMKGEDDEGELDRPRVEAKIREAQGALQAQQQRVTPPTP
jgi:tetratricopeptide (TPR) repeat protein